MNKSIVAASVISLAAAGAADTAAAADDAGGAGKRATGKTEAPVVLMLVPLAVAERDPSTKAGCWARFHDDERFRGDALTLVGPIDMANMTGPFGIDWKGKISSVETGPKARVLVYDNEDFKDLVANFDPGKRVADVSKKMGFFDEFSSLKIICGGAGGGAQQGGSAGQQGSAGTGSKPADKAR